ncbi:hypothetical protein BS47DRAFT_1323045 [Hydnum rufescens UP504]|uniref:Uncharacterized protein n=1 Tax=Hydnum rufescens UP504 TaxID=1448309 RepID=A0A9P6BDM0_9AGAM|nr:hypothetical protein BS47DRAFT_1323045 [Hydnum rufescens UP504]
MFPPPQRPVHEDSFDFGNAPPMEPDDEEHCGDSSQLMSQTQPQDFRELQSEDFSHLWGRLVPASPGLRRLDFSRTKPQYTIGRAPTADFSVVAPRISGIHCTVNYNGEDGKIIITDHSTNGTFVNNKVIGKKMNCMVKNGDEVSLGIPNDLGDEDYRYIFRTSDAPDPHIGGGIHQEYQLDEGLGKGAFATVRKAMNRETTEIVAVKVFAKSRFLNKEASMAMFARERAIISSLNHPGIVNYRNFFEDELSLFLVMEYVPGGDLLDYIHEKKFLYENEVRHITRHLCKAISYSHSMGVTHRDLKPDNILLTNTDPKFPKIADFGLAKAVDSQTFLKTMCGTPAYLAPEVITSTTGYDQTVDSWSLGVIVFCMLTGSSPFLENEEMDLAERIKTRFVNWDILQQCPTLITEQCQAWMRGMIHPDARYRMTVNHALAHPWLHDAGPEAQYDYYSSFSTLPNSAPDTGKPYDLTASSSFVSSERPRTPSPNPKVIDDCSQDLHNLRLNTSGLGNINGQLSVDSATMDIQRLASDFPSVPDIGMGYPESTSSLSAVDLKDIPALQSAWIQKVPAVGGNETLMPIANERSPSPRSAASSSPLSSVPSEDEAHRVRLAMARKNPRKKAKVTVPPRRASTRIQNRLSAMAPITPPPARKRRRLSNDSAGAGPSSAWEGPRRHSSGDAGPAATDVTATPQPLTPRRPVRSTRKTKRFQ